jgi:Skp family chaperone for outer membrane proteins
MFFLAYSNPEKFSIVMAALALVPEPMWTLLFLIVGFFLPSRMIEKLPTFKGVSAKQAKEVRDGVKEIIAMKEKMENKALELVDHSSNPSILAWRKKHKS